jgi:hypothetical protein
VLNNLQIFNNGGDGIETAVDFQDKNNFSLNNSQIYNNSGHGLFLNETKYFTINNSHVYSNAGNGVYFAGSYNSSGVLNDVAVYNNGNH